MWGGTMRWASACLLTFVLAVAGSMEALAQKPQIKLIDPNASARPRRVKRIPPPKPEPETLEASSPQESVREDLGDPIQVEVNVVNVPVTVTDKDGKYIVDLTKTDFEIFEDGKPVEIRYFTHIKEGGEQGEDPSRPPLHVGFLVDLSNTARVYYKYYQDSIGDLVYLLVPEGGTDQGFLVGYHTEVDMLVEPTEDPYPIAHKMENLKHGGGSAMLDAVTEACNETMNSGGYLGLGEPRKAIVIIGDGHDNASRNSIEQAIHACQRNQVTVHAVSTVAWGFHEAEEKNIFRLAEATGGHVTHPMEDTHTDVQGFLSKPQDAGNYVREVGTGSYARAKYEHIYNALIAVAGDVRNQYILGYTPLRPFSQGGFRDISVRIKLNANLEIRHRQGYFPP